MPNKSPLVLLSALLIVASSFPTASVPAFAASKEKVLYSLCPVSGCEGGDFPIGGVIFDSAGNLYGTAYEGGAHDAGTVFELSQGTNGTWTETVLHTFANSDGSGPLYSMTFDGAGNLFGTTFFGGSAGGGVVFRLRHGAKGWTEDVLHSFADGAEGFYPVGALILDSAGNIYGATNATGSSFGAVYQLSPSASGQWNVTVLHAFSGGRDGANPDAGLIFDTAGNLYGTTVQGGGTGCGGKGCGTIFEISPAEGQWREKVLRRFDGTDGASPAASMIFDIAGNLYGTTAYGGNAGCNPPSGCGTVFELSPGTNGEWTEKLLHSFRYNPKQPLGTLIFDKSGNLYGTASTGGPGCDSTGCGRVFELSPGNTGKWTYRVLHDFQNNRIDGNFPETGMVFDSAGNLYGTTYEGGSGIWNVGCGTVFEITP